MPRRLVLVLQFAKHIPNMQPSLRSRSPCLNELLVRVSMSLRRATLSPCAHESILLFLSRATLVCPHTNG